MKNKIKSLASRQGVLFFQLEQWRYILSFWVSFWSFHERRNMKSTFALDAVKKLLGCAWCQRHTVQPLYIMYCMYEHHVHVFFNKQVQDDSNPERISQSLRFFNHILYVVSIVSVGAWNLSDQVINLPSHCTFLPYLLVRTSSYLTE